MLAVRREQRSLGDSVIAVAVAVGMVLCAGPALAQTMPDASPAMPPASWYVVGDIDTEPHLGAADTFSGFQDRRLVGDEDQRRVALGLTFSNSVVDRAIQFTAPTPAANENADDRFTFLVSGAYDWHTGTIVTPRFMAGVGLSYLDPDMASTRLRQDGQNGSDVTPAMHLGIGADVAISSSLDLSAEYRASYRGATEYGSAEREPQIDQKFILGAKIRF